METLEVRQARVEEGIVRLHEKVDGVKNLHMVTAGDIHHIRKKIDQLAENHWKLYAKVAGLAAAISLAIKFVEIGGR